MKKSKGLQENTRTLGKVGKRKSERGLSNPLWKQVQGWRMCPWSRLQDRACHPGELTLTSGLSCRCGSVSTCRSRMVLLSTGNPSRWLARRPWAGLPRAPRRGTPRYTFLWASQSSRSWSETTRAQSYDKGRKTELNPVLTFTLTFFCSNSNPSHLY